MIRTGVPLVVALAMGAAFGCAGDAPPERAYYLLRVAPGEVPATDVVLGIGLGTVEVPPYLDRAGLALEVGPNEVREARYHLWAEPLHRGIHYYLEDRIAAALGQRLAPAAAAKNGWRYRVDVRVRRFHGDVEGDVRLDASFTLTEVATGEVLAEQHVSFSDHQPAKGYSGLVQAQISLLGRLATSIADALREVAITSG
jgi:uncharacterized lipoprotein YmbA